MLHVLRGERLDDGCDREREHEGLEGRLLDPVEHCFHEVQGTPPYGGRVIPTNEFRSSLRTTQHDGRQLSCSARHEDADTHGPM